MLSMKMVLDPQPFGLLALFALFARNGRLAQHPLLNSHSSVAKCKNLYERPAHVCENIVRPCTGISATKIVPVFDSVMNNCLLSLPP